METVVSFKYVSHLFILSNLLRLQVEDELNIVISLNEVRLITRDNDPY